MAARHAVYPDEHEITLVQAGLTSAQPMPEGYRLDRRYAALVALIAGLIFVLYLNGQREAFFPPDREILVANVGNTSVAGFVIDSNGVVSSTPTRVIGGGNIPTNQANLLKPYGLALDEQGNIYVANWGDSFTAPSITVYSSRANGQAVAPIRTISNA